MRMRPSLISLIVFGVVFTLAPICFLYYRLNSDLVTALSDESTFNFKRASSNLNSNGGNESHHLNESAICFQFPPHVSTSYPECKDRMNYLKKNWKDHSCYATNGVDGSLCSIRRYLSKVEKYCPLLDEDDVTDEEKKIVIAEPNFNMNELFNIMNDTPLNYQYMKERIEWLWPSWIEAYKKNAKRYPDAFSKRQRLNIIIHLGFLMKETKLNFGAKSRQGGPLGELLQWSDLAAILFVLGHRIFITTEKSSLAKNVDLFVSKNPCPSTSNDEKLDIIITDIMGLRAFKNYKSFLLENRCRIRLVDSFGTHVEFNTKAYFTSHKSELGGSVKNPWGGNGLHLNQYWTYYPHTPDNTFLGFAIHTPKVDPLFDRNSSNKGSLLIYGKEQYMWTDWTEVIQHLKSITTVHATVSDAGDSEVFNGIVNHGFVNGTTIHQLLKSVNIFFGLGFPFEGPAPLEAIANGAVFINPRFEPPKSRKNTKFFAEKPTLREWTSQCPYMESIGPPHVYTVDITNTKELEETIAKALSVRPPPLIPAEFTPEGMLLRVSQLVSNQDFCVEKIRKKHWPPWEALQTVIGDPGESCVAACDRNNLVCELTFFPAINQPNFLQNRKLLKCDTTTKEASVSAPMDCILQSSSHFHLFSCASLPPSGSRRLCPCRDYLSQQRALCSICV